MKKMIKTIALVAVVCFGTSTFTACKKGESDPGISLKSRKSRFAGEWKLSKGELKEMEDGDVEITTYTETSATETYMGVSTTYGYSETLIIKKDGSYTNKYVKTSSGGTAQTFTDIGRWSFMSANKFTDLKNKEAVMLTITSNAEEGSGTCNCTYTESNPADGTIYTIDQLKNKEMVIKAKTALSYPDGSYSYEVSKTFIQD